MTATSRHRAQTVGTVGHGWEAWGPFSGPGMAKTVDPESPASKASASGPSDCCVPSHWLPCHLPSPPPPPVSVESPLCSKGATSLVPLRGLRGLGGIAYSRREILTVFPPQDPGLEENKGIPLERLLGCHVPKTKIANQQSGFQTQPVDEFYLV